MNVIETIHEELKDRHLTDFEKIRYIYIRCCQIFHFDSRWFYTEVWNDYELKRKIATRKIDLENVEDFGVVCFSFNPAFKELVNAFTNADCRLIVGSYHVTSEIMVDGFRWSLDPAHGDFARGKIDLAPEGFTCAYSMQKEMLDEIDYNLGFEFKTKQDYQAETRSIGFREMYTKIGYALDDTNAKYHYTDANFFFTMLAHLFVHDGTTYLDRDYHFHNLIEAFDGSSYFDLSKDEDYYRLKEIDKDRYDYYTKILRKK